MRWFGRCENHLPTSTGKFQPGCMDVMLDYGSDGIFTRFYYPTEAAKKNSEKWRGWLPDDSYVRGLANVLMIFPMIMRLVIWWTNNLKIPANYGEKIRTNDGPLKCIVLSHGLGGNRFLYSSVCCELASRNFLVVAIEHRDNSACNTYYYTSKLAAEKDERAIIDFRHINLGPEHFKQRQEQVDQRANECSKTLDFLINLAHGVVPENVISNVPNNQNLAFNLQDLVGNIDLDSLTMMGHSFGGATALLTLSKRREFKQGILMDPWMFPIKAYNLSDKITQPLLFINTQTFHIKTNVDAMEPYLNSDDARKMFTILHTTHENQTDTPLLIGYWLNWFMKKLNPQVGLQINNAMILTFLQTYVNIDRCDIQDCYDTLDAQKTVYEAGLTRPWA